MIRMRSVAAAALLVASAGAGGCGYSLAGRGQFLPAHIRLVGIPTCVNEGSTIFNIDNILTDQLNREFASNGRYRTQATITGVDAVLACTIKSTTLTPTAVDNNNQASRYAFVVTAGIEFRDMREDKVIWQNPSLQVREEYDVTSASGADDPAAFFGQDDNALQRMARMFGRTVVSSVLEAF